MSCVEMCLIRLLIVKVAFIFNYNLLNPCDFFFCFKDSCFKMLEWVDSFDRRLQGDQLVEHKTLENSGDQDLNHSLSHQCFFQYIPCCDHAPLDLKREGNGILVFEGKGHLFWRNMTDKFPLLALSSLISWYQSTCQRFRRRGFDWLIIFLSSSYNTCIDITQSKHNRSYFILVL